MYTSYSQRLKAGIIVGTLDISAAFLYYFIRTGKNPLRVLTYIASGILGKAAYEGGAEVLLAGLVLHYIIAITFAFIFFWLFSRIAGFRKAGFLTGIAYGIFVWMVMNLLVVPLSNVTKQPFRWDAALINMLILVACIGIPLLVMAKGYSKKQVAILPG
jgi:uncharacterized membrane protein YagU involved in acid resistance